MKLYSAKLVVGLDSEPSRSSEPLSLMAAPMVLLPELASLARKWTAKLILVAAEGRLKGVKVKKE